ncbi:hypothetical protein QWU11_19400, partial [Actinomadura sp. DC4]|nr:hypothetical protein [Actinomadura sp. DC4]
EPPGGDLPGGALAPPLPLAAGAPPPGPDAIGPLAPGIGDMALVTRPGGLADLPPNPRAVPPPRLAPLDPVEGQATPFGEGTRFGGVLGDRPFAAPAGDLVRPGDLPLHDLVSGTTPGTIGGPAPAGVPNTLLGAAPLGFATLSGGLTPPVRESAAPPGVLGAPPAGDRLFAPGQQHLTEPAPPVTSRGGGLGSLPPMTGMAGAGYGGMVSAGPDPDGRMFLDDVFEENEEEKAKARERSLVGGPRKENGAPFTPPYGTARDEEKERERDHTDTTEDLWGSVAGATSLGR